MNFSDKSEPSKLRAVIGGRNGTSKPLIERTEGEKIRLASAFLRKRGYVVLPQIIKRKEIAEWLRCSEQHIFNLSELGDFPKPVDIGAGRKKLGDTRRVYRFLATDVYEWLTANDIPLPYEQEQSTP